MRATFLTSIESNENNNFKVFYYFEDDNLLSNDCFLYGSLFCHLLFIGQTAQQFF